MRANGPTRATQACRCGHPAQRLHGEKLHPPDGCKKASASVLCISTLVECYLSAPGIALFEMHLEGTFTVTQRLRVAGLSLSNWPLGVDMMYLCADGAVVCACL